MKKKILSTILTVIFAVGIIVSALPVSAAVTTEPVRYYNFSPMRYGELSSGWIDIGGNTLSMTGEGKLNVVPGAVNGIYYGPASPYGGPGSGLLKNGVLEFNYAVNFKEGANDWGSFIIFRADSANPSWAISKGVYIQINPNNVVLYKAGGELLDIIYKSLENGYEYSFKIAFLDNADGKLDVKVIIKDQDGNVFQNEGSDNDYSLMKNDIEGVTDAGFLTIFGNANQIDNYTLDSGNPEFTESIETINISETPASLWLIEPLDSNVSIDEGFIELDPDSGIIYLKIVNDADEFEKDLIDVEINMDIQMKFKSTTGVSDWGMLAVFAAQKPTAPWDADEQSCYTLQLNKFTTNMMKTIPSSPNLSFTPYQANDETYINSDDYQNLKIRYSRNAEYELSNIEISIDGETVYKFSDSSVMDPGGFFLVINTDKLDAFKLDTLDPVISSEDSSVASSEDSSASSSSEDTSTNESEESDNTGDDGTEEPNDYSRVLLYLFATIILAGAIPYTLKKQITK